jgi:ABC-type Fe3+/spermidine/putrescine transport system ATPase subunit
VACVEVRGLTKHFGPEVAVAGIDFEVPEGHFVTLLGPSGCGKTTTLRCLAGLERPDAGEIYIDNQCVAAPGQNRWVPPEKRNLGMVFQSYAVWPHLTVFDNIAYGLRVRGIRRTEIAKRTRETLELVGLHGFADRYATQLSGGQQQRVSLARALAYNPRVILFDEPLSNLDAKLREHMRLELTRLQQRLGITAVYVTHDQSEALVMSDTIIVMNHGRILQQGSPEAIYAEPASRFVADFIGVTNLLPVRVVQAIGSDGGGVVETAWGASRCIRCRVNAALPVGSDAVVTIRPEDITMSSNVPVDAENVLSGLVMDIIYLGNVLDCRVDVDGREVRVQLNHDEAPCSGDRIYLTFAADVCHCLPDDV